MPDRYAQAVRARRAELRAHRALLAGGHRAELRAGLALVRLVAADELARVLAALGRDLRRHADGADRAGRERLPALAATAVAELAGRAEARWEEQAAPVVRRIAAERGVLGEPAPGGRAPARTSRAADPLPVPDPVPSPLRALVAGASAGAWRPALVPLAVLPVLGLPALGGRAVLPLAAGIGIAALVAAAWAHRVAADRARLRRWGAEVVGTVRGRLETELGRRLLEIERDAGAALDVALARRRTEVETELRALAPDGED